MSDQISGIFKLIQESADRHGACDPLWLRNLEEPQFVTHSAPGASHSPDKPDMILLHGLFGALSNWDSSLPLFAKFTNSTALQFPILTGHRSEVKVKALAAYTEFYIRRNFSHPVILCGNSLGGHVAMRLCLSSPELVDCLILSGTSGLYEHSVDSLPIRPDERFVREHMARVFINPQFITEEAIQEITQILKHRANVLNLIHAARSAKKDNLLKLLNQIKVPTLLLWGEDDVVTTMDVARMFKANLPNSELVSVPKCGHAPMIEHPGWFAENVERFLKQHSKTYKKS